jgi:DNA invertase Pin-like site-specific DNA recombinase
MRYGYARISTQDQKLDLQIDALTKAGCDHIFHDVVSGAKTERKELDACLARLCPGDILTVWKLDRLGRSMRHLVDTVEALKAKDIGFQSLQESIDTTTPGGKLVFHIFAALAEFERDLIKERVGAGLRAAKARGRLGGRRPVLDRKRAAQAVDMARNPKTHIVDIAETLGVSESSVYRVLREHKHPAGTVAEAEAAD